MRIGNKDYFYIALDKHVLIVAVVTIGIDWTAYIGAVPGVCHESEYMSVAESGSKVSEDLARSFFTFVLPWRD